MHSRLLQAKEIFGVTANPLQARYILPDGSMIWGVSHDFREFADDDRMTGDISHNEIANTVGLNKLGFMQLGAIRILAIEVRHSGSYALGFELAAKPTVPQHLKVAQIAHAFDWVSIDVDFHTEGGMISAPTLTWENYRRIEGYLNHYDGKNWAFDTTRFQFRGLRGLLRNWVRGR